MQAKEVEQALWKTCFYSVIEEFRKRIKKAKEAGAAAAENLRKVGQHLAFGTTQNRSWFEIGCKLQPGL